MASRINQAYPAVTEADLREQIRTLCNVYGWEMYFTHDSRHSPAGFPDLVLANPIQRRMVYAELKVQGRKLTAAQAKWLAILRECGQEAYKWTEDDITEIARLLGPRGKVQ
jgi:hypothetical protein